MTFATRIAKLEASAPSRIPPLNLSRFSDHDLRLLAAIPTVGPIDMNALPDATRQVLAKVERRAC